MIPYSYFSDPTPHLYLEQLLPPDLYRQVKFPDIPTRAMGRSGRDLFVGEPGWEEAVASPGLKELHALFTSSDFVDWVLSLFAADLQRLHCRACAEDARLSPVLETREALDAAPDSLDEGADPNEVFNRFDFSMAESNYTPYVHLDSPRRIVGGLLFLSDAERDHIDGGEFVLYRDRLFLDDRVIRWPVAAKKIPVKENTGVLFLNSNRGFHGPNAFHTGTRRWVYYSISSRDRVWAPQHANMARRTMTKAVGRVCRRLRIAPTIGQEPASKLAANAGAS
jgi:hypothetical protein